MASLFEIGKSGVQAYRQALSVTGQNIANVNTDGYNKRAADLEEVPSVQGGVTNVPDQSGLGVRVNQIRRSFDTFLATNSRNTNAEYEKLDKFVDDLNRLENMLLPSDSDLGTFIGRFFNSLQDVASRPDELSARTVAIENGKALANSFNSYDKQIDDFKNTASKEVTENIKKVNEITKQLSQVNKLVMSGGSKSASPDILDARDSLLMDLSKYVNFTVDYGDSGDAKVRMGSSGNGMILLEKTNQSIMSSVIQDKRIAFTLSKDGKNKVISDVSSGMLVGLKNFYDFVGEVQSELSDLAGRVAKDFNEIQTNGIDLNGRSGKTMFSVNSMKYEVENTNKSNFGIDLIIGNEDQIKQEKMIFKYVLASNTWEVASSQGIKSYNAGKLDFDGFSINISGKISDGDKFTIQPSITKSAAFKFLLKDPRSIAAASKNLISAGLNNTSKSDLKIIGKENIKDNSNVSNIDQVFSSSSNPLLSTSFLKDGAFSIIPSNVGELKLSSLMNQSSATFGIYDNQIKGFSNISLNLSDDNSINLSSATTDPGDGIRSVKELADMLNSGLLLDGLSQHNFRKYGLFASGADGALTIKSSNSSITSGSILSNGNTFSASINQISSNDASASKIQVFTKDGRHISGSALSSSEVAAIIKESNGFLENAEYRNDYLNTNYRGIKSARITSNGDYVYNFGSSISYDKQATDDDGLFTNKNATSLSGSLTLDGTLMDSNDIDGFVTITSSGNDSGINFVVKGYDQDGHFQSETITGGNKTSVTGSKIFKSISSITSSNNGSGDLKIGVKASGYSLNITNDHNVGITTAVPINSSAYYTSSKLNKDLSGTGVQVSATTRILLGPLEENTNGTFSFSLKGSNPDSVSITSTVDADDLSGMARQINQFTSQTNIKAINTKDFDRLILISDDGYDIEMTDIVSPSDFTISVLNNNFEKMTEDHLIDVSQTNKKSAYIKGNLEFVSSSNFTSQIDSGAILSSKQDSSVNSFYNIKYNSSGEQVTFEPISLGDLDDNVSGPNGKRAQAGMSKYGIDIPLNSYDVEINDDDSLYSSGNPGGAASGKSFTGPLRNVSNLNSTLTITCAANESSNSFFITGTDKHGNTVFDKIQGVNNGVAIGSQIFKTVTSFETTATANGNVKIGTSGRHDINNHNSLVEKGSHSSGNITMNGIFSTSAYLGAKIRIQSYENESANTFTVNGVDLDGNIINETIKGTNGSISFGEKVFKTVTSISVANNTAGNVRIGTMAGDGKWSSTIDASALNADSSSEISHELIKKLREQSPTSQITGRVLSNLPSDNTNLELLFEGQKYKLSMNSGEVVVEGPENNRVKAMFEETSTLDVDGIAKSQAVSAGANVTLNGSSATSVFSGTRITIKSVNDESNNSFTISGTDLDDNAISEKINGSEAGQTSYGLKIFKTITSIKSTSTTSGNIEVGHAPGYKLTVSAEGTIEGDQFDLVQNTSNLSFASQFGVSEGVTKLTGNLAIKPSTNDIPFRLTIENDDQVNEFSVKFLSDDSATSIFSSTTVSANLPLGDPAINEIDDDSLFSGKTVSANTSFGTPTAHSSLGGKITIKTAGGGNQSSTVFTVVGTDMSGNALTETITGAIANGTSIGQKVFKTVTSITPGGTVGSGTVTVGHSIEKLLVGNVTITTAGGGDQSSTSFTVLGTDMLGNVQTEVITGEKANLTSTGTKVFKTITSVTAGGSVGSGNVTVGHKSQPYFYNVPRSINLLKSKNVSANTSLGTPLSHSGVGGKIKITTASGGNQSGTTFTVVGIGEDGGALTETIAGQPGGQSILGSKTFKSVTSVTPGGTVGTGLVDVDYSVIPGASLEQPTDLTLLWTENASGTTDLDSLFLSSSMSAGAAVQLSGVSTSTDDDSLFTNKAVYSGSLNLDGILKNSKDIRGKVEITLASGTDFTSKTFTVAGYDMDGVYKTDVINGANASGGNVIVNGKIDFKEVLSVTSTASSGTIKIGTKASSANVNGSIISITSAADETSNKFTIVGKDMFGNDQTEIITGGNNTTILGTKVFKSITSVTPSASSSGNINIGTNTTGKFSISHKIGKSNFRLDSNPNVEDLYGLKTQESRVIIDEGKIKLTSLNGKPVQAKVPNGTTSNIVSEQINLSNLPPEELIAVVMGGGARKINSQFDFVNDNFKLDDPEFEIKVDANNKNKVEIFDKKYGHSISTRILDKNRSFEAVGSRFQFTEEALLGETFTLTNNKAGSGDNRNVINMLDLQLEKMADKGKGNFQEIFSNTLAKVGSNVQANDLSLTAASSNKDAAEASQSEFSGVSLDDEAAHLLEFQQAYQASARILQTARELFESLIKVV